MSDGKQETKVQHNWLWVIVPGPSSYLYLSGYCKNCDTYFTRRLHTENGTGIYLNKVGVPKWGCVVPEGFR